MVENLSDRSLTAHELKVLQLGGGFVPTPNYAPFRTRVDVFKLIRLIKLKKMFGENTETLEKWHPKSTFNPTVIDSNISVFEDLVLRDINKLELQHKRPFYNFSVEDRKILNGLLQDPTIIFKEADKGGALVILNRDDYQKRIDEQLNDTHYYQKLSQDPTEHIKILIKIVVQEGLVFGYISDRTAKFLMCQNPKIPYFYGLPKIHKAERPPPLRPIVSGRGSVLEPLAKFVDSFFQPFIPLIPTFIKDTTHFISMIENLEIPKGAVLVSMDVNALYTNIPHEGARSVAQGILDSRTDPNPPTHFLMELLEIVLEKNYFTQEKNFFLQVNGVAMGSPVAPSVANLYMANFEKQFVLNSDYNPFFGDLFFIKRFLDDYFIIYKNRDRIDQFLQWISNIDPAIKFSYQYDFQEVNFLDTTTYITPEQKLAVKIYHKPTDRNSFLHFNSHHPRSLINSLPYSQFLRVKRNSTNEGHFKEEANKLYRQFSQRGYPNKIIDAALHKTQNKQRSTLLGNKYRTNNNNKINWGLDFTHLAMDIKGIVYKYWHIIEGIPGCQERPNIGFRRTRNLKDMLMYRRTNVIDKGSGQLPGGLKACGHCSVCKLAIQSDTLQHNGLTLTNKRFVNCSSRNVIYFIKCSCGRAYVGYTKRMIRTRICEHRSRIRNHTQDAPLVAHFEQAGHSEEDFKFWIIEQIMGGPGKDVQRSLLQKETQWIFKLNTMQPMGLNTAQDFSCFI